MRDTPGDVEVLILEFAVADAGLLSLLRARSHESWRIENELQHFRNGVYDHAMYAGRNLSTHGSSSVPKQTGGSSLLAGEKAAAIKAFPRDAIEKALNKEEWVCVKQGDDPCHYAHRLLGNLLPIRRPDFSVRLKIREGQRPVRLLSLCSGTAAVELRIISASGVKVDATFVDINHALIEQAIGGRFDCRKNAVGDAL